MTKKNSWFGILAIALVFTMMAVGCELIDFFNNIDDEEENNNSTAVTFIFVIADGSSSRTTTRLTLAFSQAITGLSAADITLTGVSGVTKGTLSISSSTYTLTTYTLPISGFSADGILNVTVSKKGYTISGSPQTETIYYNSGGEGETLTLSGPVYLMKTSTDPLAISFEEYTGENLTVTAGDIGEGIIKNGQLTITLGTPTNLVDISGGGVTISPSTTKGYPLEGISIENSDKYYRLQRGNYTVSDSIVTSEEENYICR